MKKILVLPFIANVILLIAQQPAYRSISKQAGLPANTVYNIIQDKQHYIWLGTDKGLIRYDGLHYKNYSNADLNGVSDLRIDDLGLLRCQTFSNNHYYISGDTLLQDKTWPRIGNFAPVVYHLKDTCYQLSRNIVYLHTAQSNHTLQFSHEVFSLFTYRGKIWAFDGDSVYDLPQKTNTKSTKIDIGAQTVFFTASFQDKLLLFPKKIQNGKIYELLPESVLRSIPLGNVSVQSVRVLRDSLLFVCTNSGLYVLDKQLKRLNISQPLLQNKNLSDVFEDIEGRIWVTTLDNGIFKYDFWEGTLWPLAEPVSCVSYSAATGKLQVGTVAGEVYERNGQYQLKLVYKTIERQQIISMLQTAKEVNLVAADNFILQHKNEQAEYVNLAVKKVLPLQHNSFLLGRTGGFSLLYLQGVISGDKSAVMYEGRHWAIANPFVINGGNVRVKAMVSDGTDSVCYAATTMGLLRVTANTYMELKPDGKHLQLNDIAFFRGKLYGTSGTTISEIDVQANTLKTKVFMLAENNIKNIRPSTDAVWFSAGAKLYRLTDMDSAPVAYEWNNSFEINDFSVFGNQLCIGSDQGIVQVPLDAVQTDKHELLFHIDKFTDGKQSLMRHAALSHDNNNIEIKYSIPYYGTAEDLQVFYKVNNGDWQQTESGQRELKLISLEPGDYAIQLKAENSLGQLSHIQELNFSIKPPFWKTWWFYLLSMAAVAGTGYALYSYRVKLIQQQNTLERQKIELENKLRESILASVKAQMNPHFIFNALNTIQSFIYLNDKQNATSYLGKFSQLTRTILDMSNKNSVTLQEEVDAILLYLELEKTRFDDAMSFLIEVAPYINTTDIHIPSMIIQPYIENAVKHGLLHKKGERWLKCSFELRDNFLKVTIDDNGVGRMRSQELNKIKNKQHQSFATQANEKRLDALNRGHAGAVNVHYIDKVSSEGQPTGTTVELMIAVVED